MTGTAPAPGPDMYATAAAAVEDWIEIWQSEWRAMASDRELAEAMATFAARWNHGTGPFGALAGLVASAPSFLDGEAGRSGARQASGSASTLAASDACLSSERGAAANHPAWMDAERRIAALADRVAELERRLAGLEPGSSRTG